MERALRLIGELRTVLVAMVAASVGYRGPILDGPYGADPPSWWTMEPDEKPPQYVAVTAPRAVQIPDVAEGETLLLVEQRRHVVIVESLLEAAGLLSPRIKIMAADGRNELARLAEWASGPRLAVLASTTTHNVPTALEQLREELKLKPEVRVFCATRDVEAWLLADDELLRRRAASDPHMLQRIDAMPLPDEVPDPFAEAHVLLGPMERWGIVREASVYRAAARSPSLLCFLSGIAEALGASVDLPAESAGRSINRDVIANLIQGMMPSDAIAWRTSDGHTYTAERISHEIATGTEAGRQYARDLLRVSIDYLRRQARVRKPA
jgi:hypothetical protein